MIGAQGNGIDLAVIIAAAITAIISFVVGLLVNRQERKQLFSSVVSKERMEWIKEMRKLFTELCTLCELNPKELNLSQEQKENFYRIKNDIILHLNNSKDPKQTKNFPIDNELYNDLKDKKYDDISKEIHLVREKAMRIFKTEWDKVKIEAGSSWIKILKIKILQRRLANQDNTTDEKTDKASEKT